MGRENSRYLSCGKEQDLSSFADVGVRYICHNPLNLNRTVSVNTMNLNGLVINASQILPPIPSRARHSQHPVPNTAGAQML
jgi:hypothetical protein